MSKHAATMEVVIKAVKSVCRDKRIAVGPKTKIMSELDYDSLVMLEFLSILKDKLGTDFLDPSHSIDELLSPETFVAAVLKEPQPTSDVFPSDAAAQKFKKHGA